MTEARLRNPRRSLEADKLSERPLLSPENTNTNPEFDEQPDLKTSSEAVF